jgi:hypothetical protein
MKYTQIPTTTFQELQFNAGIILSDFTPATGAFDEADILGATSGGVTFTAVPSFVDMGEDVDNCPKNMKELKRLDSWDVKMSGTYVTVDTAQAKSLIGLADVGTADTTKVTPRNELLQADFADIWLVGDYSDKNGATNGGFLAIHMMNALSTGGFSLKTADKSKGQFAFEYTAHFSNSAQDTVPFEIYIKEGTPESGDFLLEFASAAGTLTGDTALSGMTETPGASESYVYQTGYNLIVPSAGAILAGTAWTAWNGTDDITATTGMDIVLAVILTATGAAQHAGKTVVVSNEV